MDTKEVALKFGTAMAEFTAPYIPAAQRMGVREMAAVIEQIDLGQVREARDLLRQKMTPEELTAEKAALTGTTLENADANAANWKLAHDFVLGGLKVVVMVASGLVVL